MKLQKRLSRKVGDKEYDKWIITIPPSKVKELGWKEGDNIDLKIEKAQAILSKKRLQVK